MLTVVQIHGLKIRDTATLSYFWTFGDGYENTTKFINNYVYYFGDKKNVAKINKEKLKLNMILHKTL